MMDHYWAEIDRGRLRRLRLEAYRCRRRGYSCWPPIVWLSVGVLAWGALAWWMAGP